MRLQEAVATGRRYRRKKNGEDDTYFTYGSLPTVYLEDALADDWEVEPEVYEIDCGWWNAGGTVIPNGCDDFDWKSLVGKRTRLRIEVLYD